MTRKALDLDQRRYAQWVSVSHSIEVLVPGIAEFIQGLGKIDAKLVHGDAMFRALPFDQRSEFGESVRLTERFTLSQLWVLGAYEATRTIDQRVRKVPKLLTKRLGKKVLTTKRAFARVRMPLAKFEPAVAYKNTDFAVVRPAMHQILGISWRVAKRTFISRRQLSDKLLALLAMIEQHQERKRGRLEK